MPLSTGSPVPAIPLHRMGQNGPEEVRLDQLSAGKKLVVFAVPGAFTPTCHRNHMPGYVEHVDAIRAKGVDAVACLATNDVFVLDHWAETTGARGRIEMLADGNADYVRAIGLELDASGLGLGTRAQRFAMLAEDGVVKELVLEPNPGEVGSASATSMLERL